MDMRLIIVNFFLTKLVLAGLKSRLGSGVEQKHVLSLKDLQSIRALQPPSEINLVMWTAVIFGFRTLLRKSNFVPESNDMTHVICR